MGDEQGGGAELLLQQADLLAQLQPAETELAVAQLVPLVLPLVLPLLEPDELQPTVSSRLPATAAAAAIACLALKFPSQATVPAGGDQDDNLG